MSTAKPLLKINTHKNVPFKWRCVIGRYNGYANTLLEAYVACARVLSRSKYWESDTKRNPKLLEMYQLALFEGWV